MSDKGPRPGGFPDRRRKKISRILFTTKELIKLQKLKVEDSLDKLFKNKGFRSTRWK